MVHIRKWRAIIVNLWIALSFGLLPAGALADEVTLIGEVNDNYQIVVDKQILEVTNNSAGDDLVVNYVGRKVKVNGSIKEINGVKIITVKSFEAVND
jgi:bifunctional DNA-binding transcriptional regulator/antitoxin component of YhaV-PrlF toxin-antitoxin module